MLIFQFLACPGSSPWPATNSCLCSTNLYSLCLKWVMISGSVHCTRKRTKTPKALIQCEFSLAFDFQLAITIYSTAFRRAQNRTVSHEAHFGCFLTASGSDGANFKQREFPKIVEGFSQTLAFCTFAKCRTFLYFRKQTDKRFQTPMTRWHASPSLAQGPSLLEMFVQLHGFCNLNTTQS